MQFKLATILAALAITPVALAEPIDHEYWLRSIAPEVHGHVKAFRSKRDATLTEGQHAVLARAEDILLGRSEETVVNLTRDCEAAFGRTECFNVFRERADAPLTARFSPVAKRDNACCNTESDLDADTQCNMINLPFKDITCTEEANNACIGLEACGLLKQDNCNAVCGCTGLLC